MSVSAFAGLLAAIGVAGSGAWIPKPSPGSSNDWRAVEILGLFAKYWEPGAVKTRLAASIGPEAASRLYRTFLETLLARFATVADRRIVVFTPDDRQPGFAALVPLAWELWPQGTGDLGQRMRGFLQAARNQAARRIVLIGSDSPDLPGEYLELAFRHLQTHRVVVGPSVDGGYYLIGVSGTIPDVFSEIPWSTPDVFRQTERRLQELGLPYAVLPRWYDVDELQDLRRMSLALQQASDAEPALRRLRESVAPYREPTNLP
jgi:rSAM/selenodomain-associated transferase 1